VSHRARRLRALGVCAALGSFLFLTCYSSAQSPMKSGGQETKDAVTAAVGELQEQIRELRDAVAEIRAEAARYRSETEGLRRQMEQMRAEMAFPSSPPGRALPTSQAEQLAETPEHSAPSSLPDRVAKLEEEARLLNAKADEQYQTKVESATKYRVRLSGIVLMNLFSNRGVFDSQDFPTLARPSTPASQGGSFGATLRQSELGLEVFGPRLAGANTRGDVRMDFAGGFPNIPNGINSGLMRLRTATLHLDWKNTSIIGGQDEAFFSPLSPTSFATLAEPAFSYAGNLWEWVPQVRVEHRFDLANNSNLLLQGGILDNLVGSSPVDQWGNVPQAGERSSQPAYATRLAWTRPLLGSSMTLGTGAYYSRQDWWYYRHVDGWAGTADWEVPLSHGFSWSGEFYRGSAVGALGAGIGRSVILKGSIVLPETQVRPVDSIGGWSQLKFKPVQKLEFNAAYGMDNPFADDIRAFPVGKSQSNSGLDPTLKQNRSSLVNFIYRPHANLLFSAEYRHLKTFNLDQAGQAGDQVNLIMGILF